MILNKDRSGAILIYRLTFKVLLIVTFEKRRLTNSAEQKPIKSIEQGAEVKTKIAQIPKSS